MKVSDSSSKAPSSATQALYDPPSIAYSTFVSVEVASVAVPENVGVVSVVVFPDRGFIVTAASVASKVIFRILELSPTYSVPVP